MVKRILLSLLWMAAVSASITASEAITLQSEDGVSIFGEVYLSAQGKKGPVILLFHQGGSNSRGEYGDYIIPRLVENGFSIIAMDARAGGGLHGQSNRTARGLADGTKQPSYGEAYPDIEAALEYAMDEGFDGPRLAWGSSYSGALVMKLAIEYPKELDAILGFSPASGKAMGEWASLHFVGDVPVEAFLAWPASEAQRETVARTRKIALEKGFEVYTQEQGVHGSSMLHPERAEGGTEPLWDRVLEFLHEHSAATR